MTLSRAVPLSLCLLFLFACTDELTQPASEFARQDAATTSCPQGANTTVNRLLDCVTIQGVRAHQAALQQIADANGDTRFSAGPGFLASVDYVRARLEAAGYRVTLQPFQHGTDPVAQLAQVAPFSATYDAAFVEYSGSGDVTADASVPGGDITGCEAGDFAGFPAGNIALIQRGAPVDYEGTCTFALKATHAYNAGASAVVIFNNVNLDLNWTLGEDFDLDIPVVAITRELGEELVATSGLRLRVFADAVPDPVTSYNVLAELAGVNSSNVVMVGAHLDSKPAGPGINDNGSGVAAVLETAIQMGRVKPANTVRFAFWGAEELGLVGSTHYVDNLSTQELQRIALYLNFDMLGSPNGLFLIYDGDDSDGIGAGPGPAGSDQVEDVFEEYFQRVGRPYKGYDFDGRSDYGPFIGASIPAGGLFSGAAGLKTPEEASIWGGTAGAQHDPCYHEACDTYANVSEDILAINADGVAYATITLAMNTKRVNGIKGRGPFKAPGSFQLSGTPLASGADPVAY